MKNLSENAIELNNKNLDTVSVGRRTVPEYTEEIIRYGNKDGALAPKRK